MEIVYKANDGSIFTSKYDCEAHEAYIDTYNKVKTIRELYENSGYSTTDRFIVHCYKDIKAVMEETKDETDWSRVPKGTKVLVRDREDQQWRSLSS